LEPKGKAAKPKAAGSKSKAPPRSSRLPQKDAYALSDLEQIKVLADPLRIRILEALSQERTTKQVAEMLGEKPTKLYHHVAALERVGLIALSRTRQNRGTVEKYYLAVARTFRAASRVFHAEQKGGKKKNAALRKMISTFFDTTAAELSEIVDVAENATKDNEDPTKTIEEKVIVSFLEIRGTEEEMKKIRRKLSELIASVSADAERAPESGHDRLKRSRLTLAYYPLDAVKRDDR
jgi:DNA-binding transcriptional ArsR family regulator